MPPAIVAGAPPAAGIVWIACHHRPAKPPALDGRPTLPTLLTERCGFALDGPTSNIRLAINAEFRDFLGLNKGRSEEHTSELQSLMRSSYAVFCLKKQEFVQHSNTHTSVH